MESFVNNRKIKIFGDILNFGDFYYFFIWKFGRTKTKLDQKKFFFHI